MKSNPGAPEDRPLAVVLLSGGMDSAVGAAMVAGDHRLACLHVTYGQKTANRERVCFGALAHHFRAESKLVVDFEHLARIGGSALLDPSVPVPDGDPDPGEIPATYVPFRNAHLLATAVSWAEVLGAQAVVIGAVEEDSSGYPDCRDVFYAAFEQAVAHGTRPDTSIRLLRPVIAMSKGDIVTRGRELGVPFHLTWSCYRNESVACGRCDSCRLRLAGFAAAGRADPLAYEPGPSTRDSLPERIAPVGRVPSADDNEGAATVGESPTTVRRNEARARLVRRLGAFLGRARLS